MDNYHPVENGIRWFCSIICSVRAVLPREVPPLRIWLKRACVTLALLCMIGGCTTIQQMTPGYRKAVKRTQEIHALQLSVMRYADQYASLVDEAVRRYQNTVTPPEEKLRAGNWKLSQAEAAFTIASGPDPITNALDMIVLSTLSRMVIDDVWMTTPSRAQAHAILVTHQQLEKSAWGLIRDQLTDAQVEQLHQMIGEWREAHPNVRSVAYIHFLDFAKSMGSYSPGEVQATGSIFSMLGLDPFTRLDPAVREMTQTRQLAERTIYYMQRVPRLLDMQVERMSYQFASMAEVKSLLTDLDRFSLVGSASDQLAKDLPDLVARERKAFLSQLMGELDQRSETASALARELKSTLKAGTETANALHGALDSVDRISARYATTGSSEPERPFDIREYTETLRELTTATRELNTLASNLPELNRVALETTANLQSVVDRAYRRLLILIVVAIVGTLLAAIAYRIAAVRIRRGA